MNDLNEVDIPNKAAFEALRDLKNKRIEIEQHAAKKFLSDRDMFAYKGKCLVCAEEMLFSIDWLYANKPTPNWRERLVCSGCGLSNRQRYSMYLLLKECKGKSDIKVYVQEQVTPFYEAACRILGSEIVVGSEFLGPFHSPGSIVDGLRHEDAEHLSFRDSTFIAFSSNDVLEHVNEPAAALEQLCRVLTPGGIGIVSVPFYVERDHTERRAENNPDGTVTHFASPEYHGNPLSSGGSLVYSDFGWDLLDIARSAGFSEVFFRGYWSFHNGHLGNGLQMLLFLRKSRVPRILKFPNTQIIHQGPSSPVTSADSYLNKANSVVNKKVLFVLGMHRSGTSALTGVLSQLCLSQSKHPMPSSIDNPRGFFESVSIMELNNEILASCGSRWDDWSEFNWDTIDSQKLSQFKDKIQNVIISEFGETPTIVVKDPRICRIAPLWFAVVQNPLVTIPYRHPWEVAQSLLRRNSIPTEQGLLIWLRHTLDAEYFSRLLPRAIVYMPHLLNDWRSCIAKIEKKLSIDWSTNLSLYESDIDAFLDKGLKHHNSVKNIFEQEPALDGWIKETHFAMMSQIEEMDISQSQVQLDSIRRQLAAANQPLDPRCGS